MSELERLAGEWEREAASLHDDAEFADVSYNTRKEMHADAEVLNRCAAELRALAASHAVVPREATEAMLDALVGDTPFRARRTIDKSGYEVVRLTNEDWRECIGETEQVAFYPGRIGEEDAESHCARLEEQFRYAAMLAASAPPAVAG